MQHRLILISDSEFIWKHLCRSNNFNQPRTSWQGWKIYSEWQDFYEDGQNRFFKISFPDECHIEPIISELRISSGKEIQFPTEIQSLCKTLSNELGLHFYLVFQALDIHTSESDISKLEEQIIKPIVVERLVKTRTQQNKYRSNLMELWNYQCAVTGIDIPDLLIASHIKSFAVCEENEAYNPANGLLLCSHLDNLFDKGYISFDNNGKILILNDLDDNVLSKLNINGTLSLNFKNLTDKTQKTSILKFLEYHRKYIFKSVQAD